MKAYVLHGIGDIRYEEMANPVPKSNEVILKVRACGICGSDIPRIYITGAHRHPLVPGHEFAGIVCEIGDHVDPSLLGVRTGVFPLLPCKSCMQCQSGHYEMCSNYGYLGSRNNGGFAEYVAVPSWNLLPLPGNVSFEEAAMIEPMAVAVHAMRKVSPKTDDYVTVCGLGTIGLLLIMFLKDCGIKNILAIGKKDFQKEKALQLGINQQNFCDIRETDANTWIMNQTHGKGTNIFMECVGKNDTFIQSLESISPAGKIMLIGNPLSDMFLPQNDYWQILRKQLTILGTWNSSYTGKTDDDWHYVLQRLEKGIIHPSDLISHRLPFGQLEKGMQLMRDKSMDYVKVMGVM